jgi:hypothetical protein
VEGKLRELLNWGLAAPGGRVTQRAETYLTTALLGKQGEVSAIFDASLKRDNDETGRAMVTRALDALGQDPIVTRLLDRLKERSGEVYTASGRHKRMADSPLVRARSALNEREDLYERGLIAVGRKGEVHTSEIQNAHILQKLFRDLRGRRCADWREDSAAYFAWHAARRFQAKFE